jgi:hypothetical protein
MWREMFEGLIRSTNRTFHGFQKYRFTFSPNLQICGVNMGKQWSAQIVLLAWYTDSLTAHFGAIC